MRASHYCIDLIHSCVFKGHSIILNIANQPNIMPINKFNKGSITKLVIMVCFKHNIGVSNDILGSPYVS